MALNLLGKIYRDVKKDEKKTMLYFKESARAGNMYAKFIPGVMDVSLKHLKVYIDKGYEGAYFPLAQAYEIQEEYEKAIECYRQCKSSKVQCERIAHCYETVVQCEKIAHYYKAIMWYDKIIYYGECDMIRLYIMENVI
jgi:tetratricopeptide (TPR) repeat protein